MKIIAFDLETIANKKIIPILPEPKPNKRLKDPAKIKADIEEKKKKQIEEMGMNPMHNMICCAGWGNANGTNHIMLEEETEESEAELLREFWDVLSNYDHFITFNGRSFDLRSMHLHGMRYGIRPGIAINKSKYNKGNHTDLRFVLNGNEPMGKGNLNYFSKILIGEQKVEGMTGEQVQEYWDTGRQEEIGIYCEQDCLLTWDLYQRAEKAGFLE